jgi:hypothetical protein
MVQVEFAFLPPASGDAEFYTAMAKIIGKAFVSNPRNGNFGNASQSALLVFSRLSRMKGGLSTDRLRALRPPEFPSASTGCILNQTLSDM